MSDPETNCGIWLEFEIWRQAGGSDDSHDDCFNMQVKLSNGDCYALNVWTFHFLARVTREAKANSDGVAGKYLLPPDLFVEEMDRALLESVVQDLLANDGMRDEWRVPES